MSETDIVLVTGVSGFVGSAVARAFAADGCRVRGLVRGSSSRVNLAGFPGELVEGDLRDASAVAAAMAGVRHVVHVAADYRLWAPDPEEIVRNNRDTTRIVMTAALAAGVERIVYTSSVATLLPDPAGAADETRPARPDEAVGAYKRSKVVAERLVEAMVAEQGLPAVIVNPSTPIGPRDVRPTPTGRIVVEAANGRMPAFVDSGLNLVHVDDVARGHLLALGRGRIGERYILGGEDVGLGDLLAAAPRSADAACLGERAARPRDGTRAVPDARRPAHVAPPHVLRIGQGHARARLYRAAMAGGGGGGDRLVPCGGDGAVIGAAVGALALAIWIGLVASGFWRTAARDTRVEVAVPERWPGVVAVVPARDEAEVIARSIGSLVAQDYPGRFEVILVDDASRDGTAAQARSVASPRLRMIDGAPLPQGWTGKLWAVAQGIEAAGTPDFLWLTDADIEHAPDTLRTLVGIAAAGDRRLVSFMAVLRCRSLAERALVPAFVFFFQLLYPFARVNRPRGIGAAAGGCVLVSRRALAAAGGIGAIRGALIDDCALGALMKRQGPIWLGLTRRSHSIRAYDGVRPIAAMIARSAYAQLGYAPWRLVVAIAGLFLVYAAPPLLAVFGHGMARWLGLAAWALMAASFQPMLRFYRRSPLWGVALPGIAGFYAGCTLLSAWQHHRGRGGMWKGRAQAMAGR